MAAATTSTGTTVLCIAVAKPVMITVAGPVSPDWEIFFVGL